MESLPTGAPQSSDQINENQKTLSLVQPQRNSAGDTLNAGGDGNYESNATSENDLYSDASDIRYSDKNQSPVFMETVEADIEDRNVLRQNSLHRDHTEIMIDLGKSSKDLCEQEKLDVGNESASTGSTVKSTFNQVDWHHFRSHLLETIEELRIRRDGELENEEKIKQLLTEKHILTNKCDELETKMVSMEEAEEEKVATIKMQYASRIKHFEDDKVKLSSLLDSTERELKACKDEARSLQITKYTLEKQLRGHEQKQQLQTESNDTSIRQMAELEEKAHKLNKRVMQLAEQQVLLEKNVVEACRLNKKLMYVNEHKECELSEQRKEILSLRQQVVDAKVKLSESPAEVQDQLHSLQLQLLPLQDSNQANCKLVAQLKRDLENAKTDCKNTVESLEQAHRLIERHVDTNTELTSQGAECKKQLDDATIKLQQLRMEYDDLEQKLEAETTTHSQAQKLWTDQELSLQSRLNSLVKDHEQLIKAHNELENLNTKWAKKNVELNIEVKELKAELEKPKVCVEVQTEVCTHEAESQTEPGGEARSTQTEVILEHTGVQTEMPQLVHEHSQCDQPSLCQTGIQATVSVSDISIQTEGGDSSSSILDQAGKLSRNLCDAATMTTECVYTECQDGADTQTEHNGNADTQTDIVVIPDTQNADMICSQPTISQSPLEGSTQPFSTYQALPMSQSSEADVELSPQSRFTAALKTLASTSRPKSPKPQSGTICEQLIKPSPPPASCLSLKRKPRNHVMPREGKPQEGKQPRYSFQFINIPESTVPSVQGAVTRATRSSTRTIAGILQDPGAPKTKRLKSVHFSEKLEHHHSVLSDSQEASLLGNTPSTCQSNAYDDLSDDGLFSDDDSDSIELGSQVERIESFLGTENKNNSPPMS